MAAQQEATIAPTEAPLPVGGRCTADITVNSNLETVIGETRRFLQTFRCWSVKPLSAVCLQDWEKSLDDDARARTRSSGTKYPLELL
jgi:hypothetical protein